MVGALKATTEEWIGNIPESWDIERMRYSLKEINVKNSPVKTEQILSLVKDKGVMLYEEKGDVGNKAKEDITGYKVAFPDTLIVNSMNILIGSVGISKYKGCVSPVYYVFKENEKSDLRYIDYIFNTREFQRELRKYANGILEIRLRVSATDIFNRKIPVPTKDEQIKIADFLDEKCAEIDELSEDIQKQIDILNDYKKSVITRAVTKGLDPNAEMKDSGIKWIGDIPKNWTSKKVKYYLFRDEKRNPGEMPILSVYREYGVIPKNSRDDNHNATSEDTSKYKYVRPGYLVINKMKAWQGSMGVSDYEGVVSPAYFIYRLKSKDILPEYIHHLLRSCYKDEFRRISGGIREGQWDLPAIGFENTPICIPSIDEQKSILNFIDSIVPQIEESVSVKAEQILRLLEYKKSIIYEYVTGKKRVKGAL